VRGLRLTLGDIPIQIHPSFVLVLALLGVSAYEGGLIVSWVVLGTIAVLVHELGHAFTLKTFGAKPTVTLQGLGGLTVGADLGPAKGVLVSLAGPFAALVLLGLPAWLAYDAGVGGRGDGREVLHQLLFVTVGWSVLNLIPILPLDGGNVVRHGLDLATNGRGEVPARVVSLVLAGLAIGWGAQNEEIFVVVLAAMFGMLNLTELGRARATRLDDTLVRAASLLLRRDPQGAIAELEAGRRGRLSPRDRVRLDDLRAWAALAVGDLDTAATLAGAMPEEMGPSPRLRGGLAFAQGRVDEGVAVLTWAYGNQRSNAERLLIAQYLGGTGLAAAVATELLADERPQARLTAAELAEDLRKVGAGDAAGAVERLLVP
jgi:stage IV sporulation protein FB